MASEPTDEAVSISLPPDVATWIDEQAADSGADRETVLVQLLAAHRAADEMGDDVDVGSLDGTGNVEDEVRAVVAERMGDIAGAVAERLDVEREVEDAVEARRSEIARAATESATQQVESDIAALEDDVAEKLDDVRDRVIQVKRETDRKAPAEHDHPDLADRLDDLAATVEEVRDDVTGLCEDVDDGFEGHEERLDGIDERVRDVEEKLETVAYVVRDLRESEAMENKRAASVEGIKRAAAELDIDRARCGACNEGVEIALLTDPECPHCEATVTDVEAGQGLFGKPTLVKARGIEAADGEDA